jgi:predicted ATPase
MDKANCKCTRTDHKARLVVITGGPGAGKTALLEAARKIFCDHVVILPEAASILFAGGFPRGDSTVAKSAAQRAIFAIQRELERVALADGRAAVILCDRGTVDGLAYWPDTAGSFWRDTGTTRDQEMAKYSTVIHLRPPSENNGYNHQNPVRIETAKEAAAIDARIEMAWDGHPNRTIIPSTVHFLEKMSRGMEIIRQAVPDCCRV